MNIRSGMSIRSVAARRVGPVTVVVGIVMALIVCAMMLLGVSSAQALVPLLNPDEPNDSFPAATQLQNGLEIWGAIPEAGDEDFFYLDIPSRSRVTVEFNTQGVPRECGLAFMAKGGDVIADLAWEKRYDDDGSFLADGIVGPGRLFAMVSAGSGQAGVEVYTIEVTYEAAGTTASFPDVPLGSPYYEAVMGLADEEVVSGYTDGRFGPSDFVTRQQFAKMIVRAVGYPVFTSDVCPFTDVSKSYPGHYVDPNDPLYPDHYIAVAAEHHITVGLDPTTTTFGPYRNITMAQVVTMVVRTGIDLGLWDSPPHAFEPPFEDFGEPHYPYARMGAAHGLFNGYPGPWGWFAPATRGQCAFFIWKLMGAYNVD